MAASMPEQMQGRQSCPLCYKYGRHSYLTSFQINLDEAVLLCENSKCLYPVGVASCSNEGVFRRSFTSVGDGATGPWADTPCRVPSAQISLQAKFTAQTSRRGRQKAGFGTQTDSPLFNSNKLSASTRRSDIKLKKILNGYKAFHVSANKVSPENGNLTNSRVSNHFYNCEALLNGVSDGYDETENDLNALCDLVRSSDHPTQDATNARAEQFCDIPREKYSTNNNLVNVSSTLNEENINDVFQQNGLLTNHTRTEEKAKDILKDNYLLHVTNGTSRRGSQASDCTEQKQEESLLLTENRCELTDDRNAEIGETSTKIPDTLIEAFETKVDNAEVDNSTVKIADTSLAIGDTKFDNVEKDYSAVKVGDTSLEICDTALDNTEVDDSVVKIGDTTVETAVAAAPSKEQLQQLFPQWLNKEALCWLDVVLCLLVHNQTVRKLLLGEKTDKTCVLYKLLKAHDQARSILNKLQRRSSVEDQSENLDDSTTNKSEDSEERARCLGEVFDKRVGGGFIDLRVNKSQKDSTFIEPSDLNQCNDSESLHTFNHSTAFRSSSFDTERKVNEMGSNEKMAICQRCDNCNTTNRNTVEKADICQESIDSAVSMSNQCLNTARHTASHVVDQSDNSSLSHDVSPTTDKSQPQELDPAGDLSSCLSPGLNTDSGPATYSSSTDQAGQGLDPVAADMVKIHGLLEGAREEVWARLRPRLKCERGQQDSPVFATPLLLQESPEVERLFCMAYSFVFNCAQCGQKEVNEYSNVMPTFPSVAADFTMTEPRHDRACFRCSYKQGTRTMKYKKLPKCLLMHFVEGVPCSDWSRLQFGYHGNLYSVTGMVQYINQPDHFVAWLRNPKSNQWAKCDDLGTLVCQFEDTSPDIPPSQIHVIMWERQSAPRRMPYPRGINLHGTNPLGTNLLAYNSLIHNPTVLSKRSVINNVLDDPTNCKTTSAQINCHVCGQFGSAMRNNKCDKCCKLRPEASNQSNSITNPVSYPDNWDPVLCSTMKLNSNISKHFPEAGSRENLLESLVSTAKVNECSSRSSTPCSSLSSLSEISAESVTLPKFTVYTQRGTSLVRPVPCKMDVLALKSSGTSRGLKQTGLENEESSVGSDKGENSSAAKPLWSTNVLKLLQAQKMKPSGNDNTKAAGTAAKFEGLGLTGRGSLTKTFSAFTAAPKSSAKLQDSVSLVDSIASIASSKPTSRSGKATPSSGNATPKFGKATLKLGKAQEKSDKTSPNSGKDSVTREKSESCSSLTSSHSNFKLPLYLRKQNSSGNVSKTAFKTLNLSSNPNSNENTPLSSRSTTPSYSPAFVGNTSYLSTVKQYLINKTSGAAEQKFEGLNLRTAPELKRSTNLEGLQMSTPTSSPVVSDNSSNSTSSPNTNLGAIINSLLQNNNNKAVKRRSSDSIIAGQPKVVRRGSTDVGFVKSVSDTPKSSASPVSTNCDRNPVKTFVRRRRGGKNMNLIKELNEKNEVRFTPISNTAATPSPRKINGVFPSENKSNPSPRKVHGVSSSTPQKLDAKGAPSSGPRCNTDSVLQDLYEALNIPFKAVPDTMSDILMDVNDILGMVDTTKLAPSPPPAPSQTQPGNQASLDCSMILTLRHYA